MNRVPRYAAFFFLLVLLACRKDVGKINRGDYPDDIGKIVTLNCAVTGCHNGQSARAAGGLNLETWSGMFSGSSNGSPVIPYNSGFSSLCYYINTFPELGLQNKPTMPLSRPPLSYDEVKRIRDWIDKGAPDINGRVWADHPGLKKLYAVNQGCDVVTVFDSETQLPIRFVQVGTKLKGNVPHQIKVSPDGKYWYVIFINNNVMQKFSCIDDRHIGNIPLTPLAAGTGPEDALDWNTFVISKDGKRAYCVSWTASGKISSVDLENLKFIRMQGGQYYPHGICLNAANDKFYVASQTGNFITEWDTGFVNSERRVLENNAPVNTLPSLDPHEIILSPDETSLVVTCQGSNEVRVFNTATNSVTAVVSTGVYPQEIVYSKSANQYFVSCTYDSSSFSGSVGVITRIDASGYNTRKIPCGYQPHGIAVDESKKLLYVLSRNIGTSGPAPHHTSQCSGRNGFVNFIDLNTFSLLPKKYELSVDPYFIYARP